MSIERFSKMQQLAGTLEESWERDTRLASTLPESGMWYALRQKLNEPESQKSTLRKIITWGFLVKPLLSIITTVMPQRTISVLYAKQEPNSKLQVLHKFSPYN